MVYKIFRAKRYYSFAGIALPFLSLLGWAFYSVMLYYNTVYSGMFPDPSGILTYSIVTLSGISFALAGLSMRWLSRVAIIAGDDSITYARKKTVRELKYSEITGVRYSIFSFAGFKLLSKKGSIRIFKDIQGFDELYDILRRKVAAISLKEQEALPERIWATNEALADFGLAIAFAIIAILLGVVALLALPLSQAIFFMLLALSILAVAAMRLYRWYKHPYAYRFTPTEITARMLFKEDEMPCIFIKQIRLGTTHRKTELLHMIPVKIQVKAVFVESTDGKTFVIEESGTGYSAEQLYGMLRRTYGK